MKKSHFKSIRPWALVGPPLGPQLGPPLGPGPSPGLWWGPAGIGPCGALGPSAALPRALPWALRGPCKLPGAAPTNT